MYHLPRVCCTLVPEIHVCHEMLTVFWYIIDVVLVCDCQQRQVGKCADTWYKRIEPTETVEYATVVGQQVATSHV